jgi:hypothetical protein
MHAASQRRHDVVVVGNGSPGGHRGGAPAQTLRELAEQSRARSAAYDVITGQVPVTIEVNAPENPEGARW